MTTVLLLEILLQRDEMFDFIPLTFYFDIYTCKAHTFFGSFSCILKFPQVLFSKEYFSVSSLFGILILKLFLIRILKGTLELILHMEICCFIFP